MLELQWKMTPFVAEQLARASVPKQENLPGEIKILAVIWMNKNINKYNTYLPKGVATINQFICPSLKSTLNSLAKGNPFLIIKWGKSSGLPFVSQVVT